ncbi:hypothetical protein NPIL_104051 [Nephila pilipes]|uniref:Uncharacterized protein n=1 Tax=Nephila pilipes TaxID=299642 RepID=A0A8X6U4R7_NEPPI|nr:hypothetical protein NPIL_104051 [Nephila pilipes]
MLQGHGRLFPTLSRNSNLQTSSIKIYQCETSTTRKDECPTVYPYAIHLGMPRHHRLSRVELSEFKLRKEKSNRCLLNKNICSTTNFGKTGPSGN